MLDDLAGLQRGIAAAVLAVGASGASGVEPGWCLAEGEPARDRPRGQLLAELRAVPTPDSAMLSVTLRGAEGAGLSAVRP